MIPLMETTIAHGQVEPSILFSSYILVLKKEANVYLRAHLF